MSDINKINIDRMPVFTDFGIIYSAWGADAGAGVSNRKLHGGLH